MLKLIKTAFSNFKLSIKANTTVAIVGNKRTTKQAFEMISRIIQFDEGEILIDDISINDYDEEYIRKQIHNPSDNLFNRSVIDNIRFANSEISLEKLLTYAKILTHTIP